MQTEEAAHGSSPSRGSSPRTGPGQSQVDASSSDPPPDVLRLATALGGRPVIVAGSTPRGEDEAMLEAYRRVSTGAT